MNEELDTTFTNCSHGTPKCERCKNKRVIEWIRVEDELPELFKRVIVYRANLDGDENDKMHVGFLQHKGGFYGSQWGLLDDDLYPHTLVTHWMELPEPPE